MSPMKVHRIDTGKTANPGFADVVILAEVLDIPLESLVKKVREATYAASN